MGYVFSLNAASRATTDLSPVIPLSAIPRLLAMTTAHYAFPNALLLFNNSGKTIEARLRYVLEDETLMPAANIRQPTVTLPPAQYISPVKISTLVIVPKVPPLLEKIEVIHPDPAQRCSGDILAAVRRQNSKTMVFSGYGGR